VTLVWGLNWPVMKLGITHFPPLSFRSLSMWLGLPVPWFATRRLRVPLAIPRREWRELGVLTITNMIVWHVLAIVWLQALSSGRAAILSYTMPVFSALWGMAVFGQRLAPRQPMPTLAIVFWMTAVTTVVMTLLAALLEHDRWAAPDAATRASIIYNAVLIFGSPSRPGWCSRAACRRPPRRSR
jgi:hypothetical protein